MDKIETLRKSMKIHCTTFSKKLNGWPQAESKHIYVFRWRIVRGSQVSFDWLPGQSVTLPMHALLFLCLVMCFCTLCFRVAWWGWSNDVGHLLCSKMGHSSSTWMGSFTRRSYCLSSLAKMSSKEWFAPSDVSGQTADSWLKELTLLCCAIRLWRASFSSLLWIF